MKKKLEKKKNKKRTSVFSFINFNNTSISRGFNEAHRRKINIKRK
jgi:hypothetical protein